MSRCFTHLEAGSDDLTSLSGRDGGFALGPYGTRIPRRAERWVESGRRLANVLLTAAIDSGRRGGRPTGSVTPCHPPRRHSLAARMRPTRSQHSYDRSANAATPPAKDCGIHGYSIWRRTPSGGTAPAGLHSGREFPAEAAATRGHATTEERTAG